MKTFRKYLTVMALVLSGVVFLSSCDKDDDPAPNNPDNTPDSIVEIASGNEDFSILVDALVKADLVGALEGDGPFTVFAPTNAAFNALFESLNVNGINDLSAETLRPILLYHVVGSEQKAAMLNTGYFGTLNATAPNENNVSLYVEVGDNVMLNGDSQVVSEDIEASNGVIHVINKVLLPPSIVDLAISNDNFSILVEAVLKANLAGALNEVGPYTVFAPTNDAFEALFEELEVTGISDLSAEALTPILLYHVVNGNVTSSMVSTGMVPTLNENAQLDIMASEAGVMINENTNVVAVDVQGTNGVIHVIDKVLLP